MNLAATTIADPSLIQQFCRDEGTMTGRLNATVAVAPPRVSADDYHDYEGRFMRATFRADLLDTYGTKAKAIRCIGCNRRTLYRWFDDDHPHDPSRQHLNTFCRHRAIKMRVDRFLPKASE